MLALRLAARARVVQPNTALFRAQLARPSSLISPSARRPFFASSIFREEAGLPSPPPTPPPAKKKPLAIVQRSLWLLKGFALIIGSTVVGVVVVGGAIFVHDAFTYSEEHVGPVHVDALALNPKRGGPKNLHILQRLIDDDESDEKHALSHKPRLVIVGGGWGVSTPSSS